MNKTSILDVFTYLFQSYGCITVFTLAEACQASIKNQYEQSDPMDNVFKTNQSYADMAEAHGNSESQQQLMDMALMIITSAIIFADDVIAWNMKPSKIWHEFQTHFIEVQFNYKLARQTLTVSSFVYPSPKPDANLVEAPLSDEVIALREAEAYSHTVVHRISHIAHRTLHIAYRTLHIAHCTLHISHRTSQSSTSSRSYNYRRVVTLTYYITVRREK